MTNFLNDDESIRKYLDSLSGTNKVLKNHIHFKRTSKGEVNIYCDLFHISKNENNNFVFCNNALPLNLGSVRKLFISEDFKRFDDTLKNTNGFPSTADYVELKSLHSLQDIKITKEHMYDRLVVDYCQGVQSIEHVNAEILLAKSLSNLETILLHKDTNELFVNSCPKIKSLSHAIQYTTSENKFHTFSISDCRLTSLRGLPKVSNRISIVDFTIADLAGLDEEIECGTIELDLPGAHKNLSMLFDQKKNIRLSPKHFIGTNQQMIIAKKYFDKRDYKQYIMDFTVEIIDAGLEFSL